MAINVVRGQVGAKNLIHNPQAIAKDSSVVKEATQSSSFTRNSSGSDAVINTVKQKSASKADKQKLLSLSDAKSLADKVGEDVIVNQVLASYAHDLSTRKGVVNLGI